MNLGETCHLKKLRHGDGVVDDAVAMLLLLWLHYDFTQFEYVLWRHTMRLGYEYSLLNLNRPRAIHKHNPHPLKTMGRVW